MGYAAKILVVDDEAGIRFFLEELLAGDGHHVTAVASGGAALECIASEEFDLALVDLKLKDMGGMDVLAALRKTSPDTAVIVLTGHASLETAVVALRQGAHDYLFKPCGASELRESIRAGLLDRQQKLQKRGLLQQLEQHLVGLEGIRAAIASQPSASPSSVPPQAPIVSPGKDPDEAQARFLQQGDLIVDLVRHVITLQGQLLELSPTEFDLLAYLVNATPRVVSPQELVREVQGYECEPWEARDNVRYHIYRMRQKIKTATGRGDVVHTVRGVGYTIGST